MAYFTFGLHALDVGVYMAVGDENIRPAIQVIIPKKTAEAQGEQGGSRPISDRGASSTKSPFAFVVIQRKHLVGEIGDQKLGVPERS